MLQNARLTKENGSRYRQKVKNFTFSPLFISRYQPPAIPAHAHYSLIIRYLSTYPCFTSDNRYLIHKIKTAVLCFTT